MSKINKRWIVVGTNSNGDKWTSSFFPYDDYSVEWELFESIDKANGVCEDSRKYYPHNTYKVLEIDL